MQDARLSLTWIIASISLGAVGILLLTAHPFTAKAQEQKQFQYRIVEVLPDTQNMQTKKQDAATSMMEVNAKVSHK